MSNTLKMVSTPSTAPPTAAATRRIRGGSSEQERDAEEQLDRDAHQGERRELVELAREGERRRTRAGTRPRLSDDGQHPADGGPATPGARRRLAGAAPRGSSGVRCGRRLRGVRRRPSGRRLGPRPTRRREPAPRVRAATAAAAGRARRGPATATSRSCRTTRAARPARPRPASSPPPAPGTAPTPPPARCPAAAATTFAEYRVGSAPDSHGSSQRRHHEHVAHEPDDQRPRRHRARRRARSARGRGTRRPPCRSGRPARRPCGCGGRPSRRHRRAPAPPTTAARASRPGSRRRPAGPRPAPSHPRPDWPGPG